MSKYLRALKDSDKIIKENIPVEIFIYDDGKFKSWAGFAYLDIQIGVDINKIYEIILDDGRTGSISFIKESFPLDGKRIPEFKGTDALN